MKIKTSKTGKLATEAETAKRLLINEEFQTTTSQLSLTRRVCYMVRPSGSVSVSLGKERLSAS